MDAIRMLGKNRFLRYGLPFITLLVGGSFGLQRFAELRYAVKKGRTLTNEEARELGVLKKEEAPTLESEYASLKSKDLDTWQNIRGPRPWENSKEVQDTQRQSQTSTKAHS